MAKENEQLNKKEHLILEITNQLINWDQSLNHAVEILTKNDERFKKLKALDQVISDEELIEFNEKYKDNWLKIFNMQQELMDLVQKEQNQIQEQLVQIDNKKKVVSNYMSLTNKSIFIEKDY